MKKLALPLLLASPLVAQRSPREGAIVIADDAPVYAKSKGDEVEFRLKCRGAMGVAAGSGAHRPALRSLRSLRVRTRRPKSHPQLKFLQATFRTRVGSRCSASRYSIRNGESFQPSPGLQRGGGIAARCDGVRRK